MTEAKRLELYLTHRGKLVRYARSLLDDPARAEDVVHEAWMRIVKAQESQAPVDPEKYFFRAVRNLAYDIGRRHQFEQRHFKEGAEIEATRIADDTPDSEAALLAREKLRIVQQALDEMPERMRIAIEMHRFGQARLKDIAERLNISMALAHRLVSDGVEFLRERLEQRLG